MIALAAPVQAQSMNIERIVADGLERVCGPWMQSGDRAAAVQAALDLGYAPVDLNTGRVVSPADPPGRIRLDGSPFHRGEIILIESRDRVCSIDMAEATPGQISGHAAERLTTMDMAPVLERGEGPVQVVVWTGPDRQAVMAPSARSSGAALTLTWLREP